jgi:hypothetical protein
MTLFIFCILLPPDLTEGIMFDDLEGMGKAKMKLVVVEIENPDISEGPVKK